jgi:hypothetical protein
MEAIPLQPDDRALYIRDASLPRESLWIVGLLDCKGTVETDPQPNWGWDLLLILDAIVEVLAA